MSEDAGMFSLIMTNIVYAAIILTAGFWSGKFISSFVKSLLDRREVDVALSGFLGNLVFFAIVTFAAIAALSQLGIQTTSLVAVVGAAGLAIGLALKDSLGNFAAGVMILIFRQFKAGDVIEAAGVLGVVEALNIFSTQLKTGDNKTIYVPNGKLVGDNIVNYSTKGSRRLDLVIGVSYDSDLAKVKDVLIKILSSDKRVMEKPAPLVGVLELGENSVNIAVRPWVGNDDYWPLFFDLNETIKNEFDKVGISIPFPQRDIHLHQNQAGTVAKTTAGSRSRAKKS